MILDNNKKESMLVPVLVVLFFTVAAGLLSYNEGYKNGRSIQKLDEEIKCNKKTIEILNESLGRGVFDKERAKRLFQTERRG